jgi:hypothetical protein
VDATELSQTTRAKAVVVLPGAAVYYRNRAAH